MVGGGVCVEAPSEAEMVCAESGWTGAQDAGIPSAAGSAADVTPVGADGTLEEMLFGRGWEEGSFAFESDVLRL